MDKPTCQTCPYYSKDLTPAEVEDLGPGGRCRFRPPSDNADYDHGFWPVVEADDWCGSHPQIQAQVREMIEPKAQPLQVHLEKMALDEIARRLSVMPPIRRNDPTGPGPIAESTMPPPLPGPWAWL